MLKNALFLLFFFPQMCLCGPNWSRVTCHPCNSLCKSWTTRWRWTFTWTQGRTTLNPVRVLAGVKVPHVNKMFISRCHEMSLFFIFFLPTPETVGRWRRIGLISHLLSSPAGLRWVSLWAVRWCLWRSVLKAGRLLAQTGCPPSLFTMPSRDAPPRHCSGIHGTGAGHSIVFPVLFILLQISSCKHQWAREESFNTWITCRP